MDLDKMFEEGEKSLTAFKDWIRERTLDLKTSEEFSLLEKSHELRPFILAQISVKNPGLLFEAEGAMEIFTISFLYGLYLKDKNTVTPIPPAFKKSFKENSK